MKFTSQSALGRRARLAALVSLTAVMAACGGGDGGSDGLEGTFVHEEEGTVAFQAGGTGSVTQSGDPVEFEWEQEGDTVQIVIEGDVVAEATLEGGTLTFRPGDFSGDEAEVFVRQD